MYSRMVITLSIIFTHANSSYQESHKSIILLWHSWDGSIPMSYLSWCQLVTRKKVKIPSTTFPFLQSGSIDLKAYLVPCLHVVLNFTPFLCYSASVYFECIALSYPDIWCIAYKTLLKSHPFTTHSLQGHIGSNILLVWCVCGGGGPTSLEQRPTQAQSACL